MSEAPAQKPVGEAPAPFPLTIPYYLADLSSEQRAIVEEWFSAAWQARLCGETTDSAMGLLTGLIFANRMTRIVQCGHYSGYFLLLFGMLVQRYRLATQVVSFDISQSVTRFTNEWLNRAGLNDIVEALVYDSSDPFAAELAISKLGGLPELVFIDSSHQYRHTLEELDLWAANIERGGFICLHDASKFAVRFDRAGLGGVERALAEWLPRHPEIRSIVIDPPIGQRVIFVDPCGFALLHVRDTTRVPSSRNSKRLIRDPEFTLRDAWELGDGWEWTSRGVVKRPGAASSVNCFSPVVAGERYKVTVELAEVREGGVFPAAGAGGLGPFLSGAGVQSCAITSGEGNEALGLFGSATFAGRVVRFDAELIAAR